MPKGFSPNVASGGENSLSGETVGSGGAANGGSAAKAGSALVKSAVPNGAPNVLSAAKPSAEAGWASEGSPKGEPPSKPPS
jgi:hypothetical protein